MKLFYYPETDSLYMEFREGTSAESAEIADGIVADYDEHGEMVGLDVDRASDKIDLTTLDTIGLPLSSTSLSAGAHRRAS